MAIVDVPPGFIYDPKTRGAFNSGLATQGGKGIFMRIAYADPPYPGQAMRHYGREEVDHCALVHRLCDEWPDGWALSTSSSALQQVLEHCPSDVRIAAWVKPFCSFKPGVNPAYAWEPVIWRGGRKKRARTELTVRDFVSANITLKKGLSGVKPDTFSFWLFALMGMQTGDTFDDLFPGSGAVSRAWLEWSGASGNR